MRGWRRRCVSAAAFAATRFGCVRRRVSLARNASISAARAAVSASSRPTVCISDAHHALAWPSGVGRRRAARRSAEPASR